MDKQTKLEHKQKIKQKLKILARAASSEKNSWWIGAAMMGGIVGKYLEGAIQAARTSTGYSLSTLYNRAGAFQKFMFIRRGLMADKKQQRERLFLLNVYRRELDPELWIRVHRLQNQYELSPQKLFAHLTEAWTHKPTADEFDGKVHLDEGAVNLTSKKAFWQRVDRLRRLALDIVQSDFCPPALRKIVQALYDETEKLKAT